MLRAADATEMFISEGIERVMNTFNAADRKQDSGANKLPEYSLPLTMACATERGHGRGAFATESKDVHKEQ